MLNIASLAQLVRLSTHALCNINEVRHSNEWHFHNFYFKLSVCCSNRNVHGAFKRAPKVLANLRATL
jgi:hypothetical protein